MNYAASIMLVITISLGACGGSEPTSEPAPTVAPSTGNEQGDEEAVDEEAVDEKASAEEEGPAEPQAPAAGPAQLTVIAKVGNDAVSAHVKVTDESGAVVAEGTSGSALNVQSGALIIEAHIEDESVMVDKPTVRHEVDVPPGAHSEEVRFPRARVKVSVSVNGKPDTKATVTLTRNGVNVVTLTSGAADFVSITPGRYGALVKAHNAEITVPDVVIPEDSSRNIPLSVTI